MNTIPARNRSLVGAGALVLAVIGLLAFGLPSSARPPVSWQPETVDLGVPPGETLRTEVVAVIGEDLAGAAVEVTPSLSPYIQSISPETLASISAGSEVVIEIIFSVPADAVLGDVDGTLKLRRIGQSKGRGGGVAAKPLPIVLTIGDLLYPPDPGERGDETLEGVDSDGDGVRDDVQRYIAFNYPDEPTVRAGLRQYAVQVQSAVIQASDSAAALDNRSRIALSRECLLGLLGVDAGIRAYSILLSEVLDTDGRSRAYILYDRQLAGRSYPGTINDNPIDSCSFDPTDLEEAN